MFIKSIPETLNLSKVKMGKGSDTWVSSGSHLWYVMLSKVSENPKKPREKAVNQE